MNRWLPKILLAIVVCGLFAGPVLAAEIVYPPIPGAEAPQVFMEKIRQGQYPQEQALPLFLKYFFNLSLISTTLISFGSVLVGGLMFLLAGIDPMRLINAKEQMASAFLGLLLLLGSFVFFKTLNPDLLTFKLSRLPTVARPAIIIPSLPEETASVFWEIPICTLTERVVALAPKLEAPGRVLKEKTEELKQKQNELASLLNSCSCQNLSAQCSIAGCQALACSGTINTLCRNLLGFSTINEIQTKKQEVLNKAALVKTARKNLLAAKFDLEKETTRLLTAEGLMKACGQQPLDLQTFLGLEQLGKTEVKKPWPEINSQDHSLTFYCQLEEEIVNEFVYRWEEHLANLEAEKDSDPDEIPDLPPPDGPVCGENGCELGENYQSCSPDCPTPPEPEEEQTPFDWPMRSPRLIAPVHYSKDYFNCQNNHTGIDLNSREANTIVFAPADGEIFAFGDLSKSCGSYGLWLAIKHRFRQGANVFEVTTLYAHLEKILVSSGAVERGQAIAVRGNSGNSEAPHLHFGIFSNFRLGRSSFCDAADFPTGVVQDPVPYLWPGAATGNFTWFSSQQVCQKAP